ncbi:MAG: hypothetical protein KDJ83_12700, partial [Rhodobacteraceae bacterium]|nr:hypothetical protein [Paracoccaceae bacterium]
GSSVGISIVATQLAHNMAAARGDLVSGLTPFNQNLDSLLGGSTDIAATLAQLEAQLRAQAAIVAYIDDFMLMFYLTLAAIPLVFLLRRPGAPARSGETPAAAME